VFCCWPLSVRIRERAAENDAHYPFLKIHTLTYLACIALAGSAFLDGFSVPVFALLFLSTWILILLDAIFFAYRLVQYAGSRFTPLALRGIFENLEQASALINKNGWIEERNRAFLELGEKLGIEDKNMYWSRWEERLGVQLNPGGPPIKTELSGNPGTALEMTAQRLGQGNKGTIAAVIQDVTPYVELARDTERVNKELASTNERIKEMISHVAEISLASERRRISQAAHDYLGNQLSVVMMAAEAALSSMGAQPEKALSLMAAVEPLLAGTLEERLPETPLSFKETVETLSALFTKAGIPVTISMPPQSLLPAPVDHAFAGICREAMTNSLCHGEIKNLHVSLYLEGPTVRLVIADDGRGCDPGSMDKGMGMAGMRRCLAELGGTLRVGNRIEGGFAVEVEAPV
jgi:signal transduction histidine kinase